MGATGRVGPAGVTLQFAIAQGGARLWERRSGSSTSPTAEREPRGSSMRLGRWIATPTVESRSDFVDRPR
jgi:hypothetical protein